MRVALNVFGILLMLVGAVWFLQGIKLLPGSFMTGQTQWAIYGAVTFVIGALAMFLVRRGRRP